jgi:molybdate transport system regulatory protein
VPPAAVHPRIRVLSGAEIALGPGKVALLAAVAEHGCLAAAAEALGMSYMRAWRLVQTMNACFREPLVVTRRGGSAHGGAVLTPAGATVLELYRQMESESLRALAPVWEQLRVWLSGGSRRRPRPRGRQGRQAARRGAARAPGGG